MIIILIIRFLWSRLQLLPRMSLMFIQICNTNVIFLWKYTYLCITCPGQLCGKFLQALSRQSQTVHFIHRIKCSADCIYNSSLLQRHLSMLVLNIEIFMKIKLISLTFSPQVGNRSSVYNHPGSSRALESGLYLLIWGVTFEATVRQQDYQMTDAEMVEMSVSSLNLAQFLICSGDISICSSTRDSRRRLCWVSLSITLILLCYEDKHSSPPFVNGRN